MKNLLKVLFIAIISITFIGCGKELSKDDLMEYEIEMQKVTGDWVIKKYILPKDAKIYVNTYRGSYKLMCISEIKFLGRVQEIKAGIIDYKIISKEKITLNQYNYHKSI